MLGVQLAVLIPVKAFRAAKGRLAPVLTPTERAALARAMATTVVAAAGAAPGVRRLRRRRGGRLGRRDRGDGALASWTRAQPGGHRRRLDPRRQRLRARRRRPQRPSPGDGFDHLVRPATITLVPDRHDDGTNVLALPSSASSSSATAPDRSAAISADAGLSGLAVEVLRDALLCLDIDTPTDLAHPSIQEVLPSLLRASSAANEPGQPALSDRDLDGTTCRSPASALAIGAHPDDVEFGAGATLAKWASDRLRRAPSRLHRRIEGHVGPRRRHRPP